MRRSQTTITFSDQSPVWLKPKAATVLQPEQNDYYRSERKAAQAQAKKRAMATGEEPEPRQRRSKKTHARGQASQETPGTGSAM